MNIKTIYFIRHCKTDWNEQNRIQGHTDIALNATGIFDAKLLGEYFSSKKIAEIYSSPLKRAVETAEIINSYQKTQTEINIDSNIIEIDFGIASGAAYEDYTRDIQTFSVDDMETITKIQNRIDIFYNDLLKSDNTCLVVTHSLILKYILEKQGILFEPAQNSHGVVNKVQFVDGKVISHKRIDVAIHSYE